MMAAPRVVAGSLMVACSYATAFFILILALAAGDSELPDCVMVEPRTDDAGRADGLVFKPVDSCLASVTMVIYVQYLPLLDRLDFFRDMYLPYFKDVEFYVDGTWCDPRLTNTIGQPCRGEKLDRSLVPPEVHVIDGCGGGWMMQKAWIDAVNRHTAASVSLKSEEGGFLFMTDDVLINLGQLSKFAREDGCGKIWQSLPSLCTDVLDKRARNVFTLRPNRYLNQAREFCRTSTQEFQDQTRRNVGGPSIYCQTFQSDFLYVPNNIVDKWAIVSQQMTDAGLGFTFAVGTAIFGIVSNEDIAFLRTTYLHKDTVPARALRRTLLASNDTCWIPQRRYGPVPQKNREAVDYLLSMHILHPVKVSYPQTLDFALTVNRPQTAGLDGRLPEADSVQGAELTVGWRQPNGRRAYPVVEEDNEHVADNDADQWNFWCRDRAP